jgi:hypothetical protein
VAPASLRALKQWVGADGNLWVALPDNASPDLLLCAPARHYSANATVTKYKLTLTASSSSTNADLSTNTPEFCVGQTVNLSANWNPSLPSGTQRSAMPWINDGTLWLIGGNFVDNYYYQTLYPNGSLIYTNDPNYLTNEAAQVWWTSGDYASPPAYTAFFHEVLTFANGQKVNIGASGKIKMFRPKVDFTSEPPFIVALTTNGYLSLGNNDTNAMKFHSTITSTDFSGNANWVQLIERTVTGDYPGDWLHSNTFGDYYLDNDPFYNTEGGDIGTPPEHTPVGPNTNGIVRFFDTPGIQCHWHYSPYTTTITDHFKTYLVFKPTGDGIWVTLGRVDWGWYGQAFGYINGTWGLLDSSITSPTNTDTDEFPEYPDTYHTP